MFVLLAGICKYDLGCLKYEFSFGEGYKGQKPQSGLWLKDHGNMVTNSIQASNSLKHQTQLGAYLYTVSILNVNLSITSQS